MCKITPSWPGGASLDWSSIHNPVLSYPNWSIKDYACAFCDGAFHLFFSAFYEDNGLIRSHVVGVHTSDWQTFSDPVLNLAGREDGWVGMASPDIAWHGETCYLTFNSWGDKPGQPNQLFTMRSQDLAHWSTCRPLAANLTAGRRAIDAALAFTGDRCYLTWKDHRGITRIAAAPEPDVDFCYVGDGSLRFETVAGRTTSRKHENYQFLCMDGRWHLLATHFGAAHRPYLYRMQGDGSRDEHWSRWVDGYEIEIAQEGFNTEDRSNAAALYDWRARDGHYYLLYAGNTEKRTYRSNGGWGRGWNRLGLSRSTDLIHWYPAGTVAPSEAIAGQGGMG